MDYKKKLALAKEALDSGSYDKETIEYIFPELKESEDENVRKEMIQYFKNFTLNTFAGLDPKKILAWLEKQGEQKLLTEEQELEVLKKHITKDYLSGVIYKVLGEYGWHIVGQPLTIPKPIKPEEMITAEESLGVSSETLDKVVNDCIFGDVKADWSEEDERKMDDITVVLSEYANGNIPNILPSILLEDVEWLKSFKGRYIPQQKQEWTEKDEEIFKNVINTIRIGRSSCEEDDDIKDRYDEELDWIRSLKERICH